jgi:recombination protein RecT
MTTARPQTRRPQTRRPATPPPPQQQPQASNGNSNEGKAVKLSDELSELRPELEKVLPAHVTVDKFMRVVMTAIVQNPDLRRPELRRSLLTAAIKSAQDGLLPDGREAAFVVYRNKQGPTVQYMPMVAGILKKVRNSGELASLTVNVVYEQDPFRYWIDDAGEHITHEPNVLTETRGRLIAVYAIAKTRNDDKYVEVMSRGQIEQVRSISRAKDSGPWVSWYDEMARKTVIRRLAKRLPMSTDLEAVIQRDDELYDLRNGNRPNFTPALTNSGTNAAKAFLGLSGSALEDPAHAESIDELSDDFTSLDELPIDSVIDPAQMMAGAIQAIREAGDRKTLDDAWTSVVDEYMNARVDIPIEVEASYKDRKEVLQTTQERRG